jgi:hypothetical protein
MVGNKIVNAAEPTVGTDVATKSYVDSDDRILTTPGRPFAYNSKDLWYRMPVGEFGLFTTGLALTAFLEDARVLVVHQEDQTGFTFHIATDSMKIHPGFNLVFMDGPRMIGQWDVDNSGEGLLGVSTLVNYAVSIPLGYFDGHVGEQLVNGKIYGLSSGLWGR